MALERRGNGLYFYRKERRGKRVFSVYCGGGEIALLIDKVDRLERERAAFKRNASLRSFEIEKEMFTEVDQVIEDFAEDAGELADAILLVRGYHKHSRTWRRRRNARKSEEQE